MVSGTPSIRVNFTPKSIDIFTGAGRGLKHLVHLNYFERQIESALMCVVFLKDTIKLMHLSIFPQKSFDTKTIGEHLSTIIDSVNKLDNSDVRMLRVVREPFRLVVDGKFATIRSGNAIIVAFTDDKVGPCKDYILEGKRYSILSTFIDNMNPRYYMKQAMVDEMLRLIDLDVVIPVGNLPITTSHDITLIH